MKNQYVGDIGDYGKIGLLRILQNVGFQVGVNWYLTPDDNKSDGRHIHYLSKPCDTPDIDLHHGLYQLVKTGCRTIHGLESPDLLPGAIFYNDILDYRQINQTSERKAIRKEWHESAQEKLSGCDLVFLDPDNGLEVISKSPYDMEGNKYTTYQEASQYYAAGKSVLVYNHRDRSPEKKYIERFQRFYDIPQTKDVHLLCLTFKRVSVRVLLMQTEHLTRLKVAVDGLFGSSWANYFAYRAIS